MIWFDTNDDEARQQSRIEHIDAVVFGCRIDRGTGQPAPWQLVLVQLAARQEFERRGAGLLGWID